MVFREAPLGQGEARLEAPERVHGQKPAIVEIVGEKSSKIIMLVECSLFSVAE